MQVAEFCNIWLIIPLVCWNFNLPGISLLSGNHYKISNWSLKYCVWSFQQLWCREPGLVKSDLFEDKFYGGTL